VDYAQLRAFSQEGGTIVSLPQTYILIQDGNDIIELVIEYPGKAKGVAEDIKANVAYQVMREDWYVSQGERKTVIRRVSTCPECGNQSYLEEGEPVSELCDAMRAKEANHG
jgi:ribosomal protein S27AE